ncbi:hypothetical protein ABZW11_21970 [Nonomuraea sp. NPDC004580]|uniref:hypothetical protein n=1 Tax=Nonomuraea sp. NPDC004580 TaxID=3154552 RepID=UPI0033A343EE
MAFDLGVHCRQAYLVDDTDDAMDPEGIPADHPEHPVGIIRVDDGGAFLITGLHTEAKTDLTAGAGVSPVENTTALAPAPP